MWLIAHQGGWDEAVMFAIPILIAVGAVKYAEYRGAKKRAEDQDPASEAPAGES